MKIAYKITLSFLILSVILVIFTTSIAYFIAKNNLQRDIYAHLEDTINSRLKHIQTYLAMLRLSTGQLSKSVVLEDYLKKKSANPLGADEAFNIAMTRLKRTKEVGPSIFEFLLLDINGKVVAATDKSDIGIDKSTDAIFTGAQKETYIKDAYYLEGIEKPLLAVSSPMFNSQTNELIGIIVARIELTDLWGIVTERLNLGKTGETYLVNKYGYMITPSRFLKNTFLKQKVDTLNLRRSLWHKSKEFFHSTVKPVVICPNYMGKIVLGTHVYIPQMQWSLLAEISTQEVFEPLTGLFKLFLIIVFLVTLFTWILGMFLSRRITEPINKLCKGVEIIGAGSLDYKVGISSCDEIGQLSRAFDQMTNDLKLTTTSIDELNKEIAERKRAEEALSESEEKYRILYSLSADAIMIVDLQKGFLAGNAAAIKLFGCKDEQEFMKQDPAGLSPEFQPDGANSVIKAQQMMGIALEKGQHFFEWGHRRLDGKDFLATVLLTRVDLKGKKLIQATVRDITEVKAAQERMRQSAEDWQKTFDLITDLLFIQDIDFNIVRVNKSFCNALKLKADEIIGRKCYQVLHRSDKPWPGCPFVKTKVDLSPHSEEVDDPVIGLPLLVTVSPMFNNKKELIGSIHLAKDISEIKKTQEELRKKNTELLKLDQLKSDFVSMVSHELRTPLSIVKEGVSLVVEGIPGPINLKQQEILSASKNNIDRLTRIINDLLDISKIEAGKAELKKEQVDLIKLIEQILLLFAPKIKEKGLVVIRGFSDKPINIFIDADKITQVFTNLINNALKFTPKGQIIVSVKEKENEVECSVIDSGIGIAEENLSKMFEKFQQIGRFPGPGEKGTGLGLSIAKGIIELHNGRIWVESGLNKGSKFSFTLPKI